MASRTVGREDELKRIIIEVTPSIDLRQGPQVTWRADGIEGAVDVLQILHSIEANVLQQMAQAEAAHRAQSQRQAAARNGHRIV